MNDCVVNALISIIVPCFFSNKKVTKLLNSIECSFENLNYEILLIDDSNDDTEFERMKIVAHKYKGCYLYKNKHNKGAGGARNTGLEFARGEWVLFADSDDHFMSNSGTSILKELTRDTDIVFFSPTSTDSRGLNGTRHITFQRTIEKYRKNENEMLLRCQLPCVWSKLYSMQLIRRNQIWFDEIIVSNDMMFSLKAGLQASSLFLAPDIIYSWDYNENSLTTGMSKERFLVEVDVTCRYNKYLREQLNNSDYKKNRHSAMKAIVSSLFRYRFGIKYTINIIRIFIQNQVPIILIADIHLSKFLNFIRNNRLYKVKQD